MDWKAFIMRLIGWLAAVAAAAITGWLAQRSLVSPEESPALQAELEKGIAATGPAVGALAMIVFAALSKKIYGKGSTSAGPEGSGGDPGRGPSPLPVVIAMLGMAPAIGLGGLMLALCLAITGCTPAQLEAFKAVPIAVKVEGSHGTYGYDSTLGVTVDLKTGQKAELPRVVEQKSIFWNPRRPYAPREMCLEEEGFTAKAPSSPSFSKRFYLQGSERRRLKDATVRTSPAFVPTP